MLSAQPAGGNVALEGTWILNKKESVIGWYVSSATWVIKVQKDKITITQVYGPKSSYQNCELILNTDYTGETNPNCFEEAPKDATSKTLWKKDKLVREYETVDTSNHTIRKRKFRETLSISKSGRLVFERPRPLSGALCAGLALQLPFLSPVHAGTGTSDANARELPRGLDLFQERICLGKRSPGVHGQKPSALRHA